MRSVALSILLIGIVAFAFADDALPTDAASCDTPTMQAPATQALDENHIQILVFRNGGNNTGETSLPVVVDMSDTPRKYIADREFFKMVNASRDTLYAGDAARLAVNSTLYNIQGRAVIRRTQLVNGSMYFLVPEGEHFFWPGIYVGHKIERIDVPAAPGQSIIMETLALQPRLFHVRGFLTDEEVNIIHELARGKMRRSVVVSATGDVEDGARTSSNGWLYKKDAPDVLRLNQKCGALAHVDPALELEEAIQVVHYGPGQKYESHYDWFEERHFANDPNWQAGVNRMITIFFYMNNVTEGGHTVFPRAGEDGYKDSEQMNWSDCSRGVKVAPRKGDAIMWYSLKVDGQMKGEGDSMSLHAGCPPLAGEKWAANKWIYNKKKVTGESFFA